MTDHAFVAVENRLHDMAQAVRQGHELPDDAAGTLETGAAVVRQHGELLRRVKSAMGPSLVFAAAEEELARQADPRDERIFGAVRDFLHGQPAAATN